MHVETMRRVHALALAAMESVTPPAALIDADGLTPWERGHLAHCSPQLVAAIVRAFRHLPIGGPAPPIGRVVAGPALAGPGRRAAVADYLAASR
jgi:hypothetical protein